jgi:hypothetical protein
VSEFVANAVALSEDAQLVDLRGYLESIIAWCETMNSASGLYDMAFSESVMDSFDFDNNPGDSVDWFLIDGGSDRMVLALVSLVGKNTIHLDYHKNLSN